ncbi:MAG: serine protease [Pseudonocardiales bacterium]|nr:serine protease [Pseudonocardiales bacterium]
MNWIDGVIVLIALVYAFSGYRNGAVVGTLSILGFVGGAFLGGQFAHPISTSITDGRSQVPLAVAVVLVGAVLGQVLGVFTGRRLRDRITARTARAADSALGSVVSVIGVLVVAWMVALPLASAPYPGLARSVRESNVVHGLDDVMPGPMRSVYSSLRDVMDRNGFPEVFGALQPSRIFGVDPPDETLNASPVVASVRPSVVKVVGEAPSCSRISEGSGFVFAPGRVMTNAHVVAGTRDVRVESTTGTRSATVVLFDPHRDIAVLAVGGLAAPALAFDTTGAASSSDALVLGFPQDGPFDVQSARIRDRETAYGADIYSETKVSRDIYAVRSLVRPGNSGGPLLNATGAVIGVVFATAVDSADTGFALTAAEVAPSAQAGRTATSAVSTEKCV